MARLEATALAETADTTRTGEDRATAMVAACGAGQSGTVDEVIAATLQSNPRLLGVRAELEAARGALVEARYLNRFNPEVAVGTGRREFDDGGSELQPSAEVSVEIEVAGQRGKRIEAANHRIARARAELADAERLLRARVKDAYFGAVHARERLALAREVEGLNRQLADAAERRFRAGDVAQMEPNLAAIRHSQSRKDVLQAERDYRGSLLEVERTMGCEPRGDLALAAGLSIVRIDLPRSEALVAQALLARPDLAADAAEVGRLEAERSLARRLAVPNVTLGAFYDQEAESDGARDHVVGVGLKVPLPLFDRQQGPLIALAGERTAAELGRQATALEIRAEVLEAYRGFQAAGEAVDVYETAALDRIGESLRFVETAYRAGKIDLMEAIVVQNDLVEARGGYLDSLLDYWHAQTALECAVGAASLSNDATEVTK
jgi:cobalt-zinc-cadmium efflux system outer membrane protein